MVDNSPYLGQIILGEDYLGYELVSPRNFYISEVSVDPSLLFRTGSETVVLKVDFYDNYDLDVSFYRVTFYVRDRLNNEYGPFQGEIYKSKAGTYYALYTLDPTSEFVCGYYDAKAVVEVCR
ncbi:MAG: hypothetical protein DRN15_09070 [Thermoprotei archaeon]|nr:MAG: hypothetical protein DRN15_09070 [Thermoprotei archaeon]